MDNTDPSFGAYSYATRKNLALGEQLGRGVHGIVFNAESQTDQGRSAIKVHTQSSGYTRERDVYLRMRELGIKAIHGCNVPQLLDYDDELRVLEMTVVTRPFVLDFAGAFLDLAPVFSDEVMADWRAEKLEQFGARWPDVMAILQELQSIGVFFDRCKPRKHIVW